MYFVHFLNKVIYGHYKMSLVFGKTSLKSTFEIFTKLIFSSNR